MENIDEIDDIINNLQDDNVQVSSSTGGSTKGSDYKKLKIAWISERMAPNILPFEHALIERVMERIRDHLLFIEENTLMLAEKKDMKMKLLIVESELERVKFILRGYLRERLSKIDKYTVYIQKNADSELFKLSESEKSYMERWVAANSSWKPAESIVLETTNL